MSVLLLKNDHYEVTYEEMNSPNVTVVFSSGGALALAQPVEEFKKTISRFNSSYIFVRSKKLDWYNNPDSIKTMRFVSNFCNKFEKIFATGESLGGSGAVLFSKYCKKIFRILVFSPQYSALPPFCHWNGPLGGIIGTIDKYVFPDFSISSAKNKTVMLFPTTSYEDNLHARFFKAEGFDVVYIKTTHHDLARHLKKGYDIDYLHVCMTMFYDEYFRFCQESFYTTLHQISSKLDKVFTKWIGNETYSYNVFIEPSSFVRILDVQATDQSSIINEHNENSTTKESMKLLFGNLKMSENIHTKKENYPWWLVELKEITEIKEIRIFNTCDIEEKCRKFDDFSILKSLDGNCWAEVYRHRSSNYIGGEYGEPFLYDNPIECKFLKIQLNKCDNLTLSKIELYK